MRRIQRTLDSLLRERNISGYNYFPMPSYRTKYSLFLRNYHESSDYLLDVIKSLHELEYITINTWLETRAKYSFTRWKKEYRIRDDKGELLNLKVRDKKGYINLSVINSKTLEGVFPEGYISELIGEDFGYEINIHSNKKEEILKNAELFLEKSYIFNKDSWKDAYKVPAIILEGLDETVLGFLPAKLCSSKKHSFVFENLEEEKKGCLMNQQFKITPCLVNNLFFETLIT